MGIFCRYIIKRLITVRSCTIIFLYCNILLKIEIKYCINQANANLDHMLDTRPRGYKTFFMLNSIEHKISTAHKN